MSEERRPAHHASGSSHYVSRVNWPLLLGGMIVFLVAAVAVAGPDLAPRDPLEENAIIKVGDEWRIPPFPAVTPGFLLGSDQFGRDLLSRLLWAVRPTMIMVTIVAAVRLVLGVTIGLGAGWFRGWLGRALYAVISAALAVPVLMVALGAIAAIGVEAGIWAFVIGLSINGWVETARLVREQTRIVKVQAYIEAARALGSSDSQVVLRHVLRQIMPMVWMLLAFEISGTLMVTAALGFLGYHIGGDVWVLVEDTVARRISGTPELGQMLATSWVRADEPWAMIAVGTVVFATVLGFNLLGRGLRDRSSLGQISRRTILGRVREVMSKQITIPARQWMQTRITAPLLRQPERRGFFPVVGGVLIVAIAVAGLIAWRVQVTRPDGNTPLEAELAGGQQWSTERRDPQGTLWIRDAGQIAADVQWVFADPDGFPGGPAVSEDGTVYVTSNGRTLYALNPDGSLHWQTSLSDVPVGTPALSGEGQVYVTDQAGNLSAFAPTGDLLWRFQAEADDFATSGPIVGSDGTIYYVVRGGTVQAVSSVGEGLWNTRALYDPTYSPPRLSADGEYLFVKNAILNARDGSVEELETPVEVDQFITGADGNNYLQSGNDIIEWRFKPSTIEPVRSATWDYRQYTVRVSGGPTDAGVTPDQLVWLLYSGKLEDTRIVWLDKDGRTMGNAHYAQRVTQVIAVDQNATTYACGLARFGGIDCMAAAPGSNEPVWQLILDRGSKFGGGALVPGRLYVTTEDGFLYAIGERQPTQVADQGVEPIALSEKPLGPDSDKVKWRFEDPSGFASGPVVFDDGRVYIASQDGTLYALEPGGETQWEAALPAAPVGPPALGANGEIYVSDKDGNLTAFSPDGSLRWRFQPPESKPSTVGPAVGPDGTIYYTVGSSVQAVSSVGEPLWQTKAQTFRGYTPLKLDPTGKLLFFAEDVFDAQDGTLLELELPLKVDHFIVGNDGQTYLRSQHTVMQWQLADSKIEILQQAIWNYDGVVSQEAFPTDAGVTQEGTIWLFYTTPWGSPSVIAWVGLDGEIFETRTVGTQGAGFSAGHVIGVLADDATTYVCGLKNRQLGYNPATVQCSAFRPGAEEPTWQVELDETTEIMGGALASGRLYLATAEGTLYAIGEGRPLAVAAQTAPAAGPAEMSRGDPALPTDEIAWVFDDDAGFSSKPAVSMAGTVFIASKAGTLYALGPTGNTLWEATLPAAPVGPAALNASGDIYVADKEGNLSAFTLDDSLRWRYEPPKSKPSTVGPLVGTDGTIYYTIGGSVQAVSSNGEGLWNTRSQTFRTHVSLQLDATRGLLFYADDVFNARDGTLLKLESPVNADQYIAGKDGQLYLRDEHTVMQWQLKDSSVEILQSAQWDYTEFAGRGWVPDDAGVTQEGVIWTSYGGGDRVALMDRTGQLLGTVESQLVGGDVIAVLYRDATVCVCGMENLWSSHPLPYCRAFAPGTQEPILEIDFGTNEEIVGGILVPGRLYVATAEGRLYAIGESQEAAQAAPGESQEDLKTLAPAPPTAPAPEEEETVAVTPQATSLPTAIPSASVTAGDALTFIVPIVNHGPSDAPGVVVTDTLPPGVTLVSATSSQGDGCAASADSVVCYLGDLPEGASATITIVVNVDTLTVGTITHTATVASQVADPIMLDNALEQSTTVRGAADLAVTQSDTPDPAIAGLPLTYTVNIANGGPGDATGVTVTSTLPISTTFVSVNDGLGLRCTESTGAVYCDLGDLTNGSNTTVILVVNVNPSFRGTVIHVVNVTANEPDFNPLDNTAAEETEINP